VKFRPGKKIPISANLVESGAWPHLFIRKKPQEIDFCAVFQPFCGWKILMLA